MLILCAKPEHQLMETEDLLKTENVFPELTRRQIQILISSNKGFSDEEAFCDPGHEQSRDRNVFCWYLPSYVNSGRSSMKVLSTGDSMKCETTSSVICISHPILLMEI